MLFFYTRKIIAVFFILPCALKTASQSVKNCKDVHDGTFYSYPKNSNHAFKIERKGNYDKETDLTTGDSTICNTVWKNDCESVSKYVSGNAKMKNDLADFLSNHKLVYFIENVTENYYAFNGYTDKVSPLPVQSDTLWFQKKITSGDNRLFEPAGTAKDVRKLHFSDTSKYALLYLYRPNGHFKFSSSAYVIYFDNNIMCSLKNNSGFIFKVFKEGSYEIKEKLLNDETIIKLDVKFGTAYYVRSTLVWGISNKLNNFKFKTIIMAPETGKDEFEDVDVDKNN